MRKIVELVGIMLVLSAYPLAANSQTASMEQFIEVQKNWTDYSLVSSSTNKDRNCQTLRETIEHLAEVNLANQQFYELILKGHNANLVRAITSGDNLALQQAEDVYGPLRTFHTMETQKVIDGVMALQKFCPTMFQ